MTRKEQIEEASHTFTQSLPTLKLIHSHEHAFIQGSEWADANPIGNCYSCHDKIIEIYKLKSQLNIAVATLNKIGILQMGELDYTQDFFEITKTEIRDALKRIKEIK